MNQIAKWLMSEKAVFIRPEEPFTWTSGIKSPIYCDHRVLLSQPKACQDITAAFVKIAEELKPHVIAGTATAGIPWASFLAYELKLPLVYVRSSAKEHGRQNMIEGKLSPKAKVLLMEDLISTGKSSIAAANELMKADANVLSILSIFNYNFPKTETQFKNLGFKTHSLMTLDQLLKTALEEKLLSSSQISEVLQWRNQVQL
jgi:orotate phosphoribosyltransferase